MNEDFFSNFKQNSFDEHEGISKLFEDPDEK
jgi:hypothetical protein